MANDVRTIFYASSKETALESFEIYLEAGGCRMRQPSSTIRRAGPSLLIGWNHGVSGVTDPPAPKVRDEAWPVSPIDRFILAIKYSAAWPRRRGAADARTLIRLRHHGPDRMLLRWAARIFGPIHPPQCDGGERRSGRAVLANINAIDDVVYEIINTMSHLVIAGLRGNAGAGGAMLALAADRVYAMSGVVLSPHYRGMGELFGSEDWTYLL